MARQTQNSSALPFPPEHILQKILRPHIMLRKRLPMIRPPQLILLRKPLLNRPTRVRSLNNRFRTPPIARMLAHDLARHLLDRRLEPIQPQPRPFQLRSPQTPHQRTRNPRVGHGHFLASELVREESARVTGLLLAHGGEVRVDPVQRAVAVELAPVVVPGFGAVESFGDVVLALAVAGEVEEFVGGFGRGGGD